MEENSKKLLFGDRPAAVTEANLDAHRLTGSGDDADRLSLVEEHAEDAGNSGGEAEEVDGAVVAEVAGEDPGLGLVSDLIHRSADLNLDLCPDLESRFRGDAEVDLSRAQGRTDLG